MSRRSAGSRNRVSRTRIGRALTLGILAVLGGSLLLAGCSKPAKAKQQADGGQSIRVLVKDGYHPTHIEAQAGKPLKIEFYRDEDPAAHSCDADLVIPSENVNLH